jgi:hypothetical protein
MKEDTKQELYALAIPTIFMGLVLVIAGVVFYFSDVMIKAGQTTNGLVVLALGASIALGAVLYWDVATQIRLFRKDINDIKKLP